MIRKVTAVPDAHVQLVAVVDDERRNRNERKGIPHVAIEDHPHLGDSGAGASSEPLDFSPPLLDTGTFGDRRSQDPREGSCPPLCPDSLEGHLLGLRWHSCLVVVRSRQTREPVDQDEGLDSLRMRSSGH